jgi:anti-sigma factor RsiW
MGEPTCERWHELLRDYVDGGLAPGDRSLLESHAVGCLACRRALEECLAVTDLVRKATDVPIPPELRERLETLFASSKGEKQRT